MLEVISNGFNKARDRLQGRIELTESNIDDALSDIRLSLLEADVNYGVVKSFISHVKDTALGEIVETRVSHKGKKLKTTPGDHFINICHNELVSLMGPVDTELHINTKPVSSIMLIGLQGCGKTTTAGKLARLLLNQNHKPLLVAADTYRPAAVDQLHVIGDSVGVPVYSKQGIEPPAICNNAIEYAREQGRDIVIFDTAGRLAVDESLMQELEDIYRRTQPDNTLLVCDAMIGQDAVKTAEEFNRRLDLSGFILTKLDGDARGGAALSIKEVTGTPIKFLGMGESLDSLEEFRPDGLASRILGFGDVVGLMKDFESVVDEKKAEADALRMLKGQFTFIDFLDQLQSIKKMGSLQDLAEKIPFFSQMTGGAAVDDRELVKVESIIYSMTPEERSRPEIINESRKKRIARGSGRTPKDISELMKRFKQMRDMMKNMGRSGMLGKLAGGLSRLPGMSGDDMDASELMGAGFPSAALKVPKQLSSKEKRKLKSKRKQAKKSRKKGKKK